MVATLQISGQRLQLHAVRPRSGRRVEGVVNSEHLIVGGETKPTLAAKSEGTHKERQEGADVCARCRWENAAATERPDKDDASRKSILLRRGTLERQHQTERNPRTAPKEPAEKVIVAKQPNALQAQRQAPATQGVEKTKKTCRRCLFAGARG